MEKDCLGRLELSLLEVFKNRLGRQLSRLNKVEVILSWERMINLKFFVRSIFFDAGTSNMSHEFKYNLIEKSPNSGQTV